MLKLAEYRKVLNDNLSLERKANLRSVLFEAIIEENESEETWVTNHEILFQILQRNYQNPKAMNCFIFYDIEDNRLRVQIAKYLLAKGAQRVQKSVYLANISKKIYSEIFETFVDMEPVYAESDSIFMVPIGEYHLAEMKMIGKDVDMSFSKSSQHVIFI